ncbi:uncharacterized mitochondrial protein AtMg00810-like [Helianthus annuus]|uniref:uncharacterized mitochondrial protein AtMg00810-like n=1 Tax=Helianthus annuus TaxID=4232 RepID=UPI000B8F7E77|nr:uncharacterized mitochondrial protein AtMg00810-like [Helianthus annuus]
MNRPSRPPTCQLCRKSGHNASQCYHLASYAATAPSEEHLAQAFHAQCQLDPNVPDWTSDTGASSHMLPSNSTLPNATPTQGNQPSTITSFVSCLNKEFAIKDLRKLNYFLGLEVTYTPHGLFLNQSKYTIDILNRAKMLDAKPAQTPLSTNANFVSAGDPFPDATHYRSIVGALQYLMIMRPNISYAVNQVSQFLHALTVAHFQEVKRILRYLKGTIAFGLHYRRPTHTTLIGYSDADWARCLETRHSTYGYSMFLGGNLISWSAKKQPTVARSSCESEYRAMANTTAEIVWITHLLQELHALPQERQTILCDNQSAHFLTQNPVSHKRAKHIDLDYHFLRELVAAGKLITKFVPTKLQVADIFTKSLPSSQFCASRDMLCIGPPPFSLPGDVR